MNYPGCLGWKYQEVPVELQGSWLVCGFLFIYFIVFGFIRPAMRYHTECYWAVKKLQDHKKNFKKMLMNNEYVEIQRKKILIKDVDGERE